MYIYKITNKVNGKCYVGLTTKKNPNSRWSEHRHASVSYARGTAKGVCTALYRAINKHGHDNFTFEVIDTAQDRPSLAKKEQEYISNLNTLSPNGYNLTTGGELGMQFSQETLEKMRRISSGKGNAFYGKTHTKEAIERGIIGREKWRNTLSKEEKTVMYEKMAAKLRGRERSHEFSAKISKNLKDSQRHKQAFIKRIMQKPYRFIKNCLGEIWAIKGYNLFQRMCNYSKTFESMINNRNRKSYKGWRLATDQDILECNVVNIFTPLLLNLPNLDQNEEVAKDLRNHSRADNIRKITIYNNSNIERKRLRIKKMSETKRRKYQSGELVAYWKGKKRTKEFCDFLSDRCSVPVRLIDPQGNIHNINKLVLFCKENNLNYSSMRRLARGERNSCFGWTLYREDKT